MCSESSPDDVATGVEATAWLTTMRGEERIFANAAFLPPLQQQRQPHAEEYQFSG